MPLRRGQRHGRGLVTPKRRARVAYYSADRCDTTVLEDSQRVPHEGQDAAGSAILICWLISLAAEIEEVQRENGLVVHLELVQRIDGLLLLAWSSPATDRRGIQTRERGSWFAPRPG